MALERLEPKPRKQKGESQTNVCSSPFVCGRHWDRTSDLCYNSFSLQLTPGALTYWTRLGLIRGLFAEALRWGQMTTWGHFGPILD